MVDVKKSIKEYGLNILRELLNGKQPEPAAKKATLDDLTEEDLTKEKVRFEYKQRQMEARLQKVEEQKKALFEAGARTKSKRERLVKAQEFKEKDMEAENIQRMTDMISRQKRIINGLLLLKERTRVLSDSGVAGILKDVGLEDLYAYIEQATVDGDVQEKKINDLLGIMEESYKNRPESAQIDSDVMEIEKAMEQASQAGDDPDAMGRLLDELKSKNAREEDPDALAETNEAEN